MSVQIAGRPTCCGSADEAAAELSAEQDLEAVWKIVQSETSGAAQDDKMRIAFTVAFAASLLVLGFSPAPAADLSLKSHRLRGHRVIARSWCVIENLGTAVWTCAPTLAQCHAFEVPGTTLYCIRDPIPGRAYAMRQ